MAPRKLTLPTWLADGSKWSDRAWQLLAALYVIIFIIRQSAHLADGHFLEWDARAMALAALRFHNSGLFPTDLGAQLSSAMCPPGWKAIYWVATLALDPYLVTRLLPFAVLLALLWQGYRFGHRIGGAALGAVTVIVLAQSDVFWDRIVGANPRAFGFPLVVAFLRYAVEENELGVLAVLILQAAFYPSAVLFCGLAYFLTMWRVRDWRRWARLAGAGAVMAALMAPTVLGVDHRIGRPITLAELATLGQRNNWSLFPVTPPSWTIPHALHLTLCAGESGLLAKRFEPNSYDFVWWAIVLVLCALAGRSVAKLTRVYFALFASSLSAYALAFAFAYRLYVPDRMLTFAWPPLVLLALPVLAFLAAKRFVPNHAATVAGALLITLRFVSYGWAVPANYGIHDWSARDTSTTRFLATVPKDKLIAAGVDASSYVQVFAHRQTLFSAITNAPNFYVYGAEVERRIGEFYRAYYARDPALLKRLVEVDGVDFLVADARDFETNALARSVYSAPWTALAAQLIKAGPTREMILANPPPRAVVFRDGPSFVIDLRKL